jgi:pyruvate-formate lyase-activating enzyme
MTKAIRAYHRSVYARITAHPAVAGMLDSVRLPVMRKFFAFLKKYGLQVHARLSHKAFYCNALNGTSQYNISINCDLSVSCNCQDDYGEGILGDFSTDSLTDILSGPVAQSIRRKLAEGILPLRTCSRCFDLRTIDKAHASDRVSPERVAPEGIMVENTAVCNLRCIACNRASIASIRRKPRMTLDDIRNVSSTIRENGIKKLHFFKYGEPFLSPAIYDELRIIREENPGLTIIISTNGAVIGTQKQREAALFADQIYFSIHGISDEILSNYQRGGSFTKAFENMRDVVRLRNAAGRTRPLIEWKYVLFNWNDRPEMVAAAVALAKDTGVDAISFWPTNAPYYGKSLRYYVSPFFTKDTAKRWGSIREIRFTDSTPL